MSSRENIRNSVRALKDVRDVEGLDDAVFEQPRAVSPRIGIPVLDDRDHPQVAELVLGPAVDSAGGPIAVLRVEVGDR